MHLRLLLLACALSGGLPAASNPPETKSSDPARKSAQALEMGMTAEQVVEVVGRPHQVKPMPNTDGKAEVWTYRRVAGRSVSQVAANTREVPAFVGGNSQELGTRMEIDYRPVQRTKYQITALLLYEGRLTSAKQWTEVEQDYD